MWPKCCASFTVNSFQCLGFPPYQAPERHKCTNSAFPPLLSHTVDFLSFVNVSVTSSSLRRCSFCSSMRFWRSWRSCRLCSSGSRRCAASWACCLFSASERSLFSCCSRRKSRLRVDSPGTFRMELQRESEREWKTDRVHKDEQIHPSRQRYKPAAKSDEKNFQKKEEMKQRVYKGSGYNIYDLNWSEISLQSQRGRGLWAWHPH